MPKKFKTFRELGRKLEEITEIVHGKIEKIKDWPALTGDNLRRIIENYGNCPNCNSPIEKIAEIVYFYGDADYYLECEKEDWKGIYATKVLDELTDELAIKRFGVLFEQIWEEKGSKGIILGECEVGGGELRLLTCYNYGSGPLSGNYKIRCSKCDLFDVPLYEENVFWYDEKRADAYFCKKINPIPPSGFPHATFSRTV